LDRKSLVGTSRHSSFGSRLSNDSTSSTPPFRPRSQSLGSIHTPQQQHSFSGLFTSPSLSQTPESIGRIKDVISRSTGNEQKSVSLLYLVS
jgi:hypothetical protein